MHEEHRVAAPRDMYGKAMIVGRTDTFHGHKVSHRERPGELPDRDYPHTRNDNG